MARDAKYGVILDERGKLGVDEPVFVLRANDATALDMLDEYAQIVSDYGSPVEHISAVGKVRDEFERWQRENPALVKAPD